MPWINERRPLVCGRNEIYMVCKIILCTSKKHALKLMGESQHDMYALKTLPKNLWEKWHMYTVCLKVVEVNGY